ncbi:ATP-binding protein [Streptomyces rubellomurinus]|uniref:ATP-binding protein n=1 Tax=Streptomyces rubellomurinus (strain ATCC 31215) TaxID=359131 RepID=UPI000697745D|nr:ATP-binding protein [Streptomyces rubellomurinus]
MPSSTATEQSPATIPIPRSWNVDPTTEAVRPTRRLIRQIAESWGLPFSDSSLRDVELCAAELLANAVDHVREPCGVTVRWTGERLRVEVADRSAQPPVKRAPDDMATSGRGLLLVEALAHSWGWHPNGVGKVTWFEVAPDQSVTGDARLAALVFAAQVHAGPVTLPRYEVRLIDSRSPHFRLLECWGIYDREQHEYVRIPGSSDRIKRFYTESAAEAHLRYSGTVSGTDPNGSAEEGKCTT